MTNRNNIFGEARKLSALYDLPPVMKQAGYRLTQAFYTAMSMDALYWKTLLTLQGGRKVKADYRLCQELAHTWFLVESFSGAGSTFRKLNATLAKGLTEHTLYHVPKADEVPTNCFHGKMAFLCYRSETCPDTPYYRIGVFSKNLTHDGDFQNVCVLDGVAGEKETSNGRRLQAYLRYCLSHASPSQEGDAASIAEFRAALGDFDAMPGIRLAENCSVFFGGLGEAGIRGLPDAPAEPQTGKCLWDVLMRNDRQENDPAGLQAVTKGLFIQKNGACWNWAEKHEVPVWNCLRGQDGRFSDKTHMKLYWRSATDGADENELWLGSANFSAAALGSFAGDMPYTKEADGVTYGPNVECLVRLRGLTAAQMRHVEAVLAATDPKHAPMAAPPETGSEPEENRAGELAALRAIAAAHRFSYQSTGQKSVLLTCRRKDDRVRVPLKILRSYCDGKGATWYWRAVPQSGFDGEDCEANANRLSSAQKEMVVLSLWRKGEDDSPVWKCSRWCYVLPEGLPRADWKTAGQRLQKQLLSRIAATPWVEKMLSAGTEAQRQAVYESWHFAMGELLALPGEKQKRYRPFVQGVAAFERTFRICQAEKAVPALTEEEKQTLQVAVDAMRTCRALAERCDAETEAPTMWTHLQGMEDWCGVIQSEVEKRSSEEEHAEE